jgi:hypothetical protein
MSHWSTLLSSGLGPEAAGGSWRDRERLWFVAYTLFCHGELPGGLPDDPGLHRRLGYLADHAALLSDAPRQVAEFAREMRKTLPLALEPSSLIEGSSMNGGLDDISAAWGLVSGLDIGRYRSERAAIELELADSR